MEPRVDSFLSSYVVTTAWAMATLGHRDLPFASWLMHRGGRVGLGGRVVGLRKVNKEVVRRRHWARDP